ncbi:MAG TPA: hypothetical protein PJ988_07370 [Anaerolinea sp.]|nr:hypothetical protein [Anaerolinea sp.]
MAGKKNQLANWKSSSNWPEECHFYSADNIKGWNGSLFLEKPTLLELDSLISLETWIPFYEYDFDYFDGVMS